MAIKVRNNAVSIIPTAISSTATSITVTSGDGSLFPILGTGDYFYATLVSVTGAYEVVKVTARADNVMTVVRAQEGTSAVPFPANSRFEHRLTAGTLDDLREEGDEASDITFVPYKNISSTNVQAAIQEEIDDLEASTGAALIGFAPTVDVTSTNVQAAIAEVGTRFGAAYQNKYTGNGSTLAFTLSSIPVGENNTQVYIDGVYQSKDNYTVSGTTLTFSTAPPLNSEVEVIVFETTSIGETSADMVTYTPAGLGAVNTTVRTKLRETVSVKDFGAVGDGVTDDTAAIQAALDAADFVVFPFGTYLCDQISVSGRDNLHIDFQNSTIVRPAQSINFDTQFDETVTFLFTNIENLSISNVTIDHSNLTITNKLTIKNRAAIYVLIDSGYTGNNDYGHKFKNINAKDIDAVAILRAADLRTVTSGSFSIDGLYGRRCASALTVRGVKYVLIENVDTTDDYAYGVYRVSDAVKWIGISSEISYTNGHVDTCIINNAKVKYGSPTLFNQQTHKFIANNIQCEKFNWYVNSGTEYPILAAASSRKGSFASYIEYNGATFIKEDHADGDNDYRTELSNIQMRGSYFDAISGVCPLKGVEFQDGSKFARVINSDLEGGVISNSPNPSFGISRINYVSNSTLRSCQQSVASTHILSGATDGAFYEGIKFLQFDEVYSGTTQTDYDTDYAARVIVVQNGGFGQEYNGCVFSGTSVEPGQINNVNTNILTTFKNCSWIKGGKFRLVSNIPSYTDGKIKYILDGCVGAFDVVLSSNLMNPNTYLEIRNSSLSGLSNAFLINNKYPKLKVDNLRSIDTGYEQNIQGNVTISEATTLTTATGNFITNPIHNSVFIIDGAYITQASGIIIKYSQIVVTLVSGTILHSANIINLSGSNITSAGTYGYIVNENGKLQQIW